MPGQVPKRDAERRRRNAPAGGPADHVDLSGYPEFTGRVPMPAADPEWHVVARDWYESLAKSGQSLFYEPSDWAMARVLAESLSRDLGEQVVGITEDGMKVYAEIPLKGASLTAYLKGMSSLLVSEGERRRLRMELNRMRVEEKEGLSVVTDFAEMQRRRAGQTG